MITITIEKKNKKNNNENNNEKPDNINDIFWCPAALLPVEMITTVNNNGQQQQLTTFCDAQMPLSADPLQIILGDPYFKLAVCLPDRRAKPRLPPSSRS